MNHEERFALYDRRIDAIQSRLQGVPGLTMTPNRATVGGSSYGLMLDLDGKVAGKSLSDLVVELKAGTPSVWTRVVGGSMLLAVNCLADGEAEIVGKRIAEVLGKRS